MPPTQKKYTSLLDIPHARIEKCSQILDNRLQCWRAGDYQVVETIPIGEGIPDREVVYQLCNQHVKIQIAKDQQQVQADLVAAEAQVAPVPVMAAETAFTSKTESIPPGTDLQHPPVGNPIIASLISNPTSISSTDQTDGTGNSEASPSSFTQSLPSEK